LFAIYHLKMYICPVSKSDLKKASTVMESLHLPSCNISFLSRVFTFPFFQRYSFTFCFSRVFILPFCHRYSQFHTYSIFANYYILMLCTSTVALKFSILVFKHYFITESTNWKIHIQNMYIILYKIVHMDSVIQY